MNDDPDLAGSNPDATSLDDGPYPALKAFLLSRGVPRHKQTAEVAGLLGLAKTSCSASSRASRRSRCRS